MPIFYLFLGHFWASLVFLFTGLVSKVLHYMYNVIESNGCFPLFIRVSGLFAILPVIIPFLSLSLRYFSLSFPFFPFPLVFFGSGSWTAWTEQPEQNRTDWQNRLTEPTDRTDQTEQTRQNRPDKTEQNGLYLRLNQLIHLFDILHRFVCLGRAGAKKRGFGPLFYLYLTMFFSSAFIRLAVSPLHVLAFERK